MISERADFRTRNIIQDKGGYYIMTEGSILQADIIILNVYVPNNRVSKYMRQQLIELQGKINEYTMIVGDFNTLHQK